LMSLLEEEPAQYCYRESEDMSTNRTYQVHANGNADHGDLALRVTITHYDENGYMESTQTYRRHVRDLDFHSSDWQALFVAVELSKMMSDIAKTGLELKSLQPPLF